MAQRFGGKHSPDGQTRGPDAARPQATSNRPGPHPFDGKRPSGVGLRANLLFVLPFPFAWNAFTGGPAELVLSLAAFALLMGGAWLTREGIRAQDAFDARSVARRPAIPRKIFGSGLMGAGLATAAIGAGQPPVMAALLGAVGAALHLTAFGPDPLRDKGAEGIDAFQSNRVAGAVDEAERLLAAMKDAILRANDRAMTTRVDRFAAAARALFRAVEADPGDLTAVRKFLGVYLTGARDATVRYADLAARGPAPQARADYEKLLVDLERGFAGATERLRANDHAALNVEIEVLRERLAREH